MQYNPPLIEGKIIQRYKRFFTDLELANGEKVTAHTPNTGSMRGCLAAGEAGFIQKYESTTRKLPYGLELTSVGGSLIHVNTSKTNALVEEALQNKVISELSDYDIIQREYKVGQSRLDFYLSQSHDDKQKCFVEVKNVTLKESDDNLAYFPDAVSERGQKHLRELMDLHSKGHAAAMIYVIGRQDVEAMSPAFHVDPKYAELMQMAQAQGVLILPYQCSITRREIKIVKKLPVQYKQR